MLDTAVNGYNTSQFSEFSSTMTTQESPLTEAGGTSNPEDTGYQYDFAVFHSDEDLGEASKIVEYLEHENNGSFKGYLDVRDGHVGKTEIANLESALTKSKVYLILLSKSFLRSNFQTFQLHTSLHSSVIDFRFSNRLLPLLMDIIPNEVPSSLRIIQGIGYEPDDDIFWMKLKKSLKKICSEMS